MARQMWVILMRRILKLSCMAFLLTLGACGTSPNPSFYTLGVVQGTTSNNPSGVVKIVQPELPEYLDRPEFVSRDDAYKVNINETVNWAEPLASLFERILADDLQQRLPYAIVETDADDKPTLPPEYIIETKIQQFNPSGQGQIILSGNLTLTSVNGQVRQVPIDLKVSGSDKPSAMAAALSVLVGKYTDQIAAELASTHQH